MFDSLVQVICKYLVFGTDLLLLLNDIVEKRTMPGEKKMGIILRIFKKCVKDKNYTFALWIRRRLVIEPKGMT